MSAQAPTFRMAKSYIEEKICKNGRGRWLVTVF